MTPVSCIARSRLYRVMSAALLLTALIFVLALTPPFTAAARDYVTPDEPLTLSFEGPIALSQDGRYVLIYAWTRTDTWGRPERGLYVYDRLTTILEQLYIPGLPAGPYEPTSYHISADGRYIAVTATMRDYRDRVYRYDRETGLTTLVSRAADGRKTRGFTARGISGDGRYVLFEGHSNRMPDGYVTPCPETLVTCNAVFRYDAQTGQTRRVSVNSAGLPASHSSALSIMSEDGRYVVFFSNARNLGGPRAQCRFEDETYPCYYLFLHDTVTGTTRYIPAAGDGVDETIVMVAAVLNFDLSADGRYLVYATYLPGTDNPRTHIYDTLTGETEIVTLRDAEGRVIRTLPASTFFNAQVISADGRFLLLQGFTGNVTYENLWVYDRQTGEAALVRDSAGQPISSSDGFAALSADGSTVAVFEQTGEDYRLHLAQGAPLPLPPATLVVNGGAEVAGAQPHRAAAWLRSSPTGARRRCNNAQMHLAVARIGACAFQVRAAGGVPAWLRQSLDITGLAAGETLTLSAWVRGKNLMGEGVVQLVVSYTDGSQDYIALDAGALNAGTYPYRQLAASGTLAADKTVQSVVVELAVSGGVGRLLVDHVMVTR